MYSRRYVDMLFRHFANMILAETLQIHAFNVEHHFASMIAIFT